MEPTCFSEDSESLGTLKAGESDEDAFKPESLNNGESDFQLLRSRLSLLQHSLEEQQVASSYLREERDEAVNLNRTLQRELEKLRREVCTRKKSSSPKELQSKQSRSDQPGPLKEGQTVVGCILGLPKKCVRGLVNRVGLFVWWTGVWANQGLGILRIENKWVELERLKCELEQDNSKLVQQAYDLQKMLKEKEVEIVAEMERNKALTRRLNRRCSISCGRCPSTEKMSKHIHALMASYESLYEEIDRIEGKIDRRFAQFERVHHEIGRLNEGQRLLEIADQNLERKVKTLEEATTQNCHYCSAEFLQASDVKGKDETDTEKAALAINAKSEKHPAHLKQNQSKVIGMLKGKLSRVPGLFCWGFRGVALVLITFLVTGFLFHFILVASSLRLPSSPAGEYYGVDLFALWTYFINWLFSLLVTE